MKEDAEREAKKNAEEEKAKAAKKNVELSTILTYLSFNIQDRSCISVVTC